MRIMRKENITDKEKLREEIRRMMEEAGATYAGKGGIAKGIMETLKKAHKKD